MSFLNFGFLSFYPTRTEIIILKTYSSKTFKETFLSNKRNHSDYNPCAINQTFRMESFWLIPLCSLNFATGQPASFYEEGRNSNQK